MTNSYVTAFEARIVLANVKNTSASNIKKLNAMRDAFSSQAITAIFESANAVTDFMSDIYDSERAVKFAALAIDHKYADNNAMMFAAFRTAINCYRNNTLLLRQDIYDSCSAHNVVADTRKHLVFQRNTHAADDTVKRQHTMSLNALKILNIISVHNETKNAFEVHLTDLAKAICEKLNIDIEKVEQEIAA